MQSGISVSPSLHSAFNTLVSSPTQRYLLATIESESLTPVQTLESSTTFPSSLSLLTPHLPPTAALYVLIKAFPAEPNGYICATYIPNAAPVRQKMLFASTRLSLARELGVERFRETLVVTEAEELSEDGWSRHEAHARLEAPLTEEERSRKVLEEVEAREGGGMAGRGHYVEDSVGEKGAGGGKLALRVGEGVLEALRGLQQGEAGTCVQVKVDTQTETLVLESTSTTAVSSLSSNISSTDPRYTFYLYNNSKVIFIYTCPTQSKIKERMMYASSRARVVSLAENEAGLVIAKRLEGSQPSEFDGERLEKEFEEQKVEKQGFARPKRPGRR